MQLHDAITELRSAFLYMMEGWGIFIVDRLTDVITWIEKRFR
jgi:hypothetical protein